jgi:hypothetical protein
MSYFGVSNADYLNDPFINEISLFPNIREEILLNSVKLNKIYNIPSMDASIEKFSATNYDPIPILYQHRENEFLTDIWKNIKNGDIVTNRGSKKSMSYSLDRVIIEKKWIQLNVDEHEKYIYLISPKQIYTNENLSIEQKNVGIQAPAAVFETPSNHTVYRYMKKWNEDLHCFEHYTCEIDGFVISKKENNEISYVPVEFKCFKNPETHELDIENLWENVKISTALQCLLTDIKNVIFGFRNNLTMKLKYYSIPEIIDGIEHNVYKAFERMESNTIKLVNQYKKCYIV